MILTVIELDETCPLDRFAGWLQEPSASTAAVVAGGGSPVPELRVVRAWAGETVPTADEAGDGLVVLGGQTHAYDETAPGLVATRDLLAGAVAAGLPTFGICLGAQLLAVATGGRVHVGAPPGREVGVVEIHPRPDAARDPLFADLAVDVAADHPLAGGVLLTMPTMHADAVVDLPRAAVWLASSRLYPYQAFRVGQAAWGVQFHPEVGEEVFTTWARSHEDVDVEAVVGQLRTHDAEVVAGGRALAQRFVGVVAARVAELALSPA